MVNSPYPPHHFDALATLVDQLSKEGAQTIIFADTFHPAGSHKAIGNDAVMGALKRNHFNDFYDEAPEENIWRKLLNHPEKRNAIIEHGTQEGVYQRNDPEARRTFATSLVTTMEQWKKHGITPHFPDNRIEHLKEMGKADPQIAQGEKVFWNLGGYITDAHCASVQSADYFSTLNAEDNKALYAFANKLDSVIANNQVNHDVSAIANHTSQKGKRAYFYGLEHTTGSNDLDENNPNAKVIALAERPGNALLAEMHEKNQIRDMPDYVFYNESGKVIKLDTPEAQREFFFGAPDKLKFWLTPKEEAACHTAVHYTPHQFLDEKAFGDPALSVPIRAGNHPDEDAFFPLKPGETPRIQEPVQRWDSLKPQR